MKRNPIFPEVASETDSEVPLGEPIQVPEAESWAKLDWLIANHGIPKGADVSVETQFMVDNPNWNDESGDDIPRYIYRPVEGSRAQPEPEPEPVATGLTAEQLEAILTRVTEGQKPKPIPQPRPGFKNVFPGDRTGNTPEQRIKTLEELNEHEIASLSREELDKVLNEARKREKERVGTFTRRVESK